MFLNRLKVRFMNVIIEYPNIKPLLIRVVTFPMQFIISLVIWKMIYENASDEMIQSLLVMSSVLFVSTILLFGGHTNLGNLIIDQSPESNAQFGLTMVSPLMILIISIPIIFIFSDELNNFFLLESGQVNVLILLACSITLIAPSAAFQSIFVAVGKNSFIAFVPFFGSIFSLILALFLFRFTDTTYITSFLVVVSSSMFSTLILGIRAVKLIPLKKVKFNKSSFGSYFNLGSLLISVGAPLAFQLDRILIVRWGNVNDALESAPVNRMVASVTLILSAAAMSLWPYLKLREDNEITKKYMVNSFIVAIPFTISIFLIGPYLVRYVSSGKIAFSLMSQASVAFFVLSYSLALVPILVLSDRNGQLKVFISMTLNAACTVFTCFLLIPLYGLAGYYISSALCTIICVVIPLYLSAVKQVTQEQIKEG